MEPTSDQNRQAATGPINVEMSLSSKTIMQGEPLVLSYTVTNALPEVTATYMGIDLKDWLTFRLVDAAGQTVPTIPDPRPENPGGLHADGARISPHSYFRSYVVLSQRFAITRIGEHDLSVRIHLPYAPDERDPFIWPVQFEQIYGTVFRAERSFSFSVTEANPNRLWAIAEQLREQITQEGNAVPSMPLECLFSMPEEYALPSWKGVAHEPSLSLYSRQWVAEQLARLTTITAADILADMIWNPTPPPAVRGHLFRYLHNMYFNAAPELKEHLKKVFREHGQEIADQPILITD